MKKYNYYIKNVDCAHCAQEVENNIAKIEGLNNVSYNFASTRLTFDTDLNEGCFEKLIKKAVYAVEPDATLERIQDNKQVGMPKSLKSDLIRFLIGLIIGIAGFIIEETINIEWLVLTLYLIAAVVLICKTFIKAVQQLFLSRTIAESMLITIAVIGSFALGEYTEGLMVIGLYSVGKMLESKALFNSRKSIQGLMEVQPEFAVVIDGKAEKRVLPSEVGVGSIIVVRAGERVPLDGEIISGGATVNKSHLTGESLPFMVKKGDKVSSGSIVLDGMLEIKTESVYSESTIARIMGLIENATEKKSKTETFISKFSKWYTIIVMSLAVIVTGISFLIGDNVSESVERGLIFLVISCPCAFAISVPLAYFSAIGKASKRGILIKGSNYLDIATKLNKVIFDKTGTLTTGQFGVEEIVVLDKNYTDIDILRFAAMGEQYSIHPVAKAIMHMAHGVEMYEVEGFHEDAGIGVSYYHKGKKYFIGKDKNDQAENTTSVFVHINEKVVGEILLSDALKPGSSVACNYLQQNGVKIAMLSGDGEKVTTKVAHELKINDYKYSLLPNEKYELLEKDLDKSAGYVSFVGDGINDAPSLRRADLGVSMGLAGSPATVEASDIVLVDDEPTKLVDTIRLAKYTRSVVWQNIIFAIVTKIAIMILDLFGNANLLLAVFADVGVTLIAIFSSLRILKFNFDKYYKRLNNR